MHYRGVQKFMSPEVIGTPVTSMTAPIHAGPVSESIAY